MLLDCGSGTLHALPRYDIEWKRLTHVCLTHFHIDHVGDLPGLLTALRLGVKPPRTEPLTLVGPPGLDAFLRRLGAALGPKILEPGFPVHIRELAGGGSLDGEGGAFRLSAHPTPHTPESLAYRWEAAGRVVAYTGDTGPSESVAHFLGGADVLVAECTEPDPPTMASHLSPERLARLAEVARPELLVVTHVFPPQEPDDVVRQVAQAGYEGRVVAGYDGLRIPLAASGPVDPIRRPV